MLTDLSWREMFRTTVYQENLVGIVVDEAHCVQTWHYDEYQLCSCRYPESLIIGTTCLENMDEYRRESCIRGYHKYKETWEASIGDELKCIREP